MVSAFVDFNRKLSHGFARLVNKTLGRIDDSEEYFAEQVSFIDLSSSRVLEIGGTQRPLFEKKNVLFYVGLDIDSEFDWTAFYHQYYNQSCTEPINGNFDFIFSKYLLEHVDDNKKTFENIISSLESKGKSLHFFPLGYHPYSLLTRLIGNSLQRKLIPLVRSHSVAVTGYPVYYNMCNSESLKRFFKKQKQVNYTVRYFYGADDYFAFFFPFYVLSVLFNRISSLLGIRILASNVVLTLTKKES